MPTVKYLAISMLFFLPYFLLVGQKGGDGFHIGFQKNGKSIFYGSSVRMGHKVYIFPILLAFEDTRDEPAQAASAAASVHADVWSS